MTCELPRAPPTLLYSAVAQPGTILYSSAKTNQHPLLPIKEIWVRRPSTGVNPPSPVVVSVQREPGGFSTTTIKVSSYGQDPRSQFIPPLGGQKAEEKEKMGTSLAMWGLLENG